MSRVQLFAQCSALFCIPLYGHLHWARPPLPSLDSSTQTILQPKSASPCYVTGPLSRSS